MTWSTMAALGLLSGVHCATMCAPLALASTTRSARGAEGAWARWLGYLGARLISYTTFGAVVGAIGQHALCELPVATVQLVASLLVAAFAASQGLALLRAGRVRAARPRLIPLRVPSRRPVLRALAELLPRRGPALGAITGLLPCGALLGAYLLAATSASPLRAAALMAVFALASAPGLIVPGVLRGLVGRRPVAWSTTARALGWWLLAAYSAARPWLGAHHH